MAKNFLNQIEPYNVRSQWPEAGNCALLVVDMQQYFLPIASQILSNVLSLINSCRSKRIHIFFTRHGHKDVSLDGGMLANWWGDCIEYGTKQWDLIKTLSPYENETIIDKNRYSAFYGTDLDNALRSLGVEEIIITGVLTNCCCETTARDGFIRDYRVFFVSDATATVNEDLHLASLKNLAYGFAHILSTELLCHHFK